MTKKWIGFCLMMTALALAGCVTTVTNLTATSQARNPNNLYLIEYQWDTTQQTIRPDSISTRSVMPPAFPAAGLIVLTISCGPSVSTS